jgi:DNA polymerase-1
MKLLTLDVETSTVNKGNPFSESGKLVYVGLLTDDGTYKQYPIEYGDTPYGDTLGLIQEEINAHDCLVGFNIKFDLHWLLRYGISLQGKKVFDTQLAEFIIRNQSVSYPSLHDTAVGYGFSGKLDVVKEEYWKKGIDTQDVPEDVLQEYLKQDVMQTHEVYKKQQEEIPESKKRLISLANQDLLTLLDIEHNGMRYDVTTSKITGDNVQETLNGIDQNLVRLTGLDSFNPGSGDHISAVLYGGVIRIPFRESFIFTYKDGRTTEKQRWAEKEVTFNQLVKPLRGSELKKEGYYATNADTLLSLKSKGKAKEIITLLLERSKLEKLRGTYLHGLPTLIETMQWPTDTIHGTLNQCVAITGRLSSTKPNMQNFDKGLSHLFVTRY